MLKDLTIEEKQALYKDKTLTNGCLLCNNVSPLPDEYTTLTQADIADGIIEDSIDPVHYQDLQGKGMKDFMKEVLFSVNFLKDAVCDERQGYMADIVLNVELFADFEIAYETNFKFDEKTIETKDFQIFFIDVANYYMFTHLSKVHILILYLMYYHAKVKDTNKDVYVMLCMLLQLFYHEDILFDQQPGTCEHAWWETVAPRSIDLELMNWLANIKWFEGRIVYEKIQVMKLASFYYNVHDDGTLTLREDDDEMLFKTTHQIHQETDDDEEKRKKKKQRVSKDEVIVIDEDTISEADTVVETPKTVLYNSVIRNVLAKFA
jgi:hypothetical protein